MLDVLIMVGSIFLFFIFVNLCWKAYNWIDKNVLTGKSKKK